MPEIFEIVTNNGIELINNIRANLGSTGTNATLRTSQSLRIEVKNDGLKVNMKLFGRAFFNTVETGRRPTPDKKPSKEFIENLKPWMAARGIDEKQVWAIATKINKQGTKLWKAGGREDILQPAVDTFVNNVSQQLLDSAADNFQIKIRELEW